MSGLIDDSWILAFACAFNLLPYFFVVVEVYEENLASLQYVVGKKRGEFI